jgi:hypothetical protein
MLTYVDEGHFITIKAEERKIKKKKKKVVGRGLLGSDKVSDIGVQYFHNREER